MSIQVDNKPSAVLIESYNERMSQFLLSENVRNVEIVFGETDSDGVTVATIIIPGKNNITTNIKRLNIEDATELTSIEELGGKRHMRLLIDDQVVNEEAIDDIMSAIGLNAAELPTEESAEFETSLMFSAALWVNQGVFIPPSDITVVDISGDYSEYLTENDNVRDVFEVVAKPTSLAYTGSAKAMMLTKESPTPPSPTYDLDLSEVTNSDAPGQWTLEVDVETDEVPVASVLTELALTAVNNAHDTTIVTADVTSNLEGKTLTIYTLKENASNVTGTLIVTVILNVTPPPVVKFDLSTITNDDEAGVWTLDVNESEISEVTAQSATQAVLDTFNTTSDIQITYDQLDAVKEDTLVTVTPNESGSELLEGTFIITLNVIADLP